MYLDWYGEEFVRAKEEFQAACAAKGALVPYRRARIYGISIVAQCCVEELMRDRSGSGSSASWGAAEITARTRGRTSAWRRSR